ncbi:MAG: IS66 family insertion sequence element accessory protein TnpA [Candidatus Rokuibacteriota bacterium]
MSPRTKQVRQASASSAFVKKYLNSGLTQKAFCQREDLVYATFQSWLRKYRTTQQPYHQASPRGTGFIPLRVQPAVTAPHATFCTLEYPNGVRLHLAAPLDPQLLSHLIYTAGAQS